MNQFLKLINMLTDKIVDDESQRIIHEKPLFISITSRSLVIIMVIMVT